LVQMTPPMGWNSWNTFGPHINEELLKTAADALVDTGLAAAGYNYLVIDDCWALKQRDEKGRLVADPEKFPNGIKAVSDYVHSKGLKFGIYSCAGTMTCAQYPGSYEYEFIDAATFAEWGVDFLKYDYCFTPAFEHGELLYRRMGLALANCGRDILFSACSWGNDDTKSWIKTTGAHMWRSTHDVMDSWESIKTRLHEQFDILHYNGQGCFNDMDMLVVGMNGKGNVGITPSSFTQYRTHFTMWALFGSPLMIGCDIRSADAETLNLLKNREVLAINQDPAYRQPFMVGGFQNWHVGNDQDHFTFAKLLEGGDIAIGMFNLSDDPANIFFHLTELGLTRGCGVKLAMKELWSGEETESRAGMFTTTIGKHDCRIYRCRLVKDGE